MSLEDADIKLKGVSTYEINTQKQIIESFRIFDQGNTGKTEIKNIEIIVRALGRVPRKAEIRNFIKEVEDRNSKGLVKLETLLPALTNILLRDKWKPAPKERLLQAFEFLDTKKSGCINPDHMKMLLTEHGDKLDEKEAESFLTLAVDPFKKKIDFMKCYEKLAVPEVVDIFEDKKKIMKEIKDKLPQK